jgi:NAD-dependent deacetylase
LLKPAFGVRFSVVPGIGLEPIRPQWTQDFKSCVSTNSTTWAFSAFKKNPSQIRGITFGAKDEVRTRDLDLGKVALYQLSYFRINLDCKSKKKIKPAKKFLKSFVNLIQNLTKPQRMKPKIVVFTGAGISAESGIKTFRDSDGLWEEYRIEDVATPQAWCKNKELVLDFYNKRRKQMLEASPNAAHNALVVLEKKYDVHIITQNVDNLHERAGSTNVLHLHGELMKSRSTLDASLVYPINGAELNIGDRCEKGAQLRPHIVWFGEMVPQMENAYAIAQTADIFIVVGTSLAVYPAAGLLDYVPAAIPKFLIDPNLIGIHSISNLTILKDKAGTGLPNLVSKLLSDK